MPISNRFCSLGSPLVLSYNGEMREGVDDGGSGIVLTGDGKVYKRRNHSKEWRWLKTPSVFYFYNNSTRDTYLVDTCKGKIEKTSPYGRILDIVDRIIYEIIDDRWQCICDLGTRRYRTRCSNLIYPCDHVEIDGEDIRILPGSDLPSKDLITDDGGITVTRDMLLEGGITMLMYRMGDLVVTHNIYCDEAPVGFSARSGMISIAPSSIDDCMVFPIIDWDTIYGKDFDDIRGVYTVPKSGMYDIGAVFSYPNECDEVFEPYFALLVNRDIEMTAPMDGSQAVMNGSLPLDKGDSVRIVLFAEENDKRLHQTGTSLRITFSRFY